MSQYLKKLSLYLNRSGNTHNDTTNTLVSDNDDDTYSVNTAESDTSSKVTTSTQLNGAHGVNRSIQSINHEVCDSDNESTMTSTDLELYEPFISDKILFHEYVDQFYQSLSSNELQLIASSTALKSNAYNEFLHRVYNDSVQLSLTSSDYTEFEYNLYQQANTATNYIKLELQKIESPGKYTVPTIELDSYNDVFFDLPMQVTQPAHNDIHYTIAPLSAIQRSQLCVDTSEPADISTNDSTDSATINQFNTTPPHKIYTAVYNNHEHKSACLYQYEPMRKWNQDKIRPSAAPQHLQQLQYTTNDIEQLINDANNHHNEILVELIKSQQQLSSLCLQHNSIRDNILNQLQPKHCAIYKQRYQQCQKHLYQLYYDAISFSSICRQYDRGYCDVDIPDAYKRKLDADTLLHLSSNDVSIQSTDANNKDAQDTADDELQVCDVCHLGDTTKVNPICFCERCNIAVHKRCYGLDEIPDIDIDWYCNRCTYILMAANEIAPAFTAVGKPIAKLQMMQPFPLAHSNIMIKHDITTQCVLCPIPGGALKPTTDGAWCHIKCALWTPYCMVDNYKTMEPIKNISAAIEYSKQCNSICYICNKSVGAVVKCSNNKCIRKMHASCCWYAGLYMKTTSNDSELLFHCYCIQHTPNHSVDTLSKQYTELSHTQLIQLRALQQSELRIRGRTDLFVTKVRNTKKIKTQSQRIANTNKSSTEDRLELGRCAVCFYNNQELQYIMNDVEISKHNYMPNTDSNSDNEHMHHNHHDSNHNNHTQYNANRSRAVDTTPLIPYPHQRTPSQREPQLLLQCNKCGVEVHPICYGVSFVTAQLVNDKRKPDQSQLNNMDTVLNTHWVCNRCHAAHTQNAYCVICNRNGGALKPVADQSNKWCHVVCALWIVGLEFGDTDKLEPVTGINTVNKQQRKTKCSICKKIGPCIQCRQCDTIFHPMCNYLSGAYMGMYHSDAGSFEALYIAACMKHSNILLSRPLLQPDDEYIDIMYKRLTTYLSLYITDNVYQREQIKLQLHETELDIAVLQRLDAFNNRYNMERGGHNSGKIKLRLSRNVSGEKTNDTNNHHVSSTHKDTPDIPTTSVSLIMEPQLARIPPRIPSALSNINNLSATTPVPAIHIRQSSKRKLSDDTTLTNKSQPTATLPPYKYELNEDVYIVSGGILYHCRVVDRATIQGLIDTYLAERPKTWLDHNSDGWNRLINGISDVKKKDWINSYVYLLHYVGWANNQDEYYIEKLLQKNSVIIRELYEKQHNTIKSKSTKKKH